MLEFLSAEDGVDDGLVEVTVVGGYEDARGDAAKNSISLLRALQDDDHILELRHFCVGPYNTKVADDNDDSKYKFGPKTAILKGIAIDLQSQLLFPAIFDWCNYADFQTQIQVGQYLHCSIFLTCAFTI